MTTIEREDQWLDHNDPYAFLRPSGPRRRVPVYGEYEFGEVRRDFRQQQQRYADENDEEHLRAANRREHARYMPDNEYYDQPTLARRREVEDYRRAAPLSRPSNGRQSSNTKAPENYKTVMCINFPNCTFGSKCTFAHSSSELRIRTAPPIPKDYKKIHCRDWPNNCVFGERCKYFHPYEIDPYAAPPRPNSTKSTASSSGVPRVLTPSVDSNSSSVSRSKQNPSILSQLTERTPALQIVRDSSATSSARSASPVESIKSVESMPCESPGASVVELDVSTESSALIRDLPNERESPVPRTGSPIPLPPPMYYNSPTAPVVKEPQDQRTPSPMPDEWPEEKSRTPSPDMRSMEMAAEVELPIRRFPTESPPLLVDVPKRKTKESTSSCFPPTTGDESVAFFYDSSSRSVSSVAQSASDSEADYSTCSMESTTEHLASALRVRRSRSARSAILVTPSTRHSTLTIRWSYVAGFVVFGVVILVGYVLFSGSPVVPTQDEI